VTPLTQPGFAAWGSGQRFFCLVMMYFVHIMCYRCFQTYAPDTDWFSVGMETDTFPHKGQSATGRNTL